MAAAVFVICECSLLGQPVQKYDRLTVVAQRAELMIRTKVVGFLHRGDTFSAQEIRGGWNWVSEIGRRGWVRRSDAMPIDQAIRFFGQAIRQNPTAADYAIRGRLRNMKGGQIAEAIADFTEAASFPTGSSALMSSLTVLRGVFDSCLWKPRRIVFFSLGPAMPIRRANTTLSQFAA